MTELEKLEKELLEEIQEEPEIYADTEEFCTINPETRIITVPTSKRILGTESDQETNRLYFKCPKIVGDNVDLSLFSLRINYQNAGNKKDQYLVEDVKEEGDNITFSWLLKRNVTAYKGNVKFILCAVKTTEDGIIKNEWNTTLNTECESLEGMEVDKVAVEEETKDIVEQLIAMMNHSAENAVRAVEEAKAEVDKEVGDFALKAQQALADVNNAGQAQTERVQTAGNDAVESVKAAQGTATRAVETAKTEAIEAVQTEGATQAGNVSAEGEKQVQAVRGAAQEIMADREQIQENKTGIAKLKEDIVGLDNRKADAIVETASGTPLDVTDSAKLPIQNLRVFGKSEQNGVPSLDAPIPIVNVGEKGNVDIKINTGNLFDINAVKKYEVDNTTLSLSVSGNKIIFNSKISTGKEAIMNILGKNNDAIKLPLGKYILSYKSNKPFGSTNGTDTVEMYACIRTGDSTVYRATGTKNYVIFEIKEGDELFLRFDINKSGQSAEFYDIMLNHGESVLPYELYFNQSLTLSTPNGLPGIKVDSGGNYTDATGQQWVTDEIDLERGKYIQRVKKLKPLKQVVFNKRDENGRCSVFDTGIFREIFKGGNIPAISSIAKWSAWGNKEDNTFALGVNGIYYKDSTKTLEEVNTLFEKIGTNFEVCGVLETSVEHDLALETISSFKSLHTNYPTTSVSNNGDAEMELTYIADTKKYIDKKFEELNQAIVNTQIALL